MNDTLTQIITENNRRKAALHSPYDPIRGIGCAGTRIEVQATLHNDGHAFIPREMTHDKAYLAISSHADWVKLRCQYDFEYWCATCVEIKDKITGEDHRFILNKPQRRVAALLEKDRLMKRPIRAIMLKARQWGGSTLVQMYMAWLQITQCRNWHSLICAHVKDTAASIRGLYAKMLNAYPEEYWDGDEKPKFRPFERSVNIREIAGRNCRVTIGSSENQEAVRGSDYAMAHLSEVAFWSDSSLRSPDKFIRAVCGAIALAPNTLIIMESTANGVGNYFHSEWLRARDGKSDKRPIMVPWYEIEIYRSEVTDVQLLWEQMDSYERHLWDMGLTLEMIQWYHLKRMEYPDHSMMMAEYPTDDTEAFTNTGHNIFAAEAVERLRENCCPPRWVGELSADAQSGPRALCNIRFNDDSTGLLQVWQKPQTTYRPKIRNRYVVAVDIGGRSRHSDYSVISVFDRQPMLNGSGPEVVAQWRGHIDHDCLAWKCAMIAQWYDNALLVIESNTLETENCEGDHNLFILNSLGHTYRNLYYRTSFDNMSKRPSLKVGFHTNSATKTMVINSLIQKVRENAYTERSSTACDEFSTYEIKNNGSFGAKAGYHDDVLMTRAIGLHIATSTPLTIIDDPSNRSNHATSWSSW